MADLNIAAWRLHSQHISGTKFKNPAEVVEWMGAVQAQDYLSSLWAVGLRMQSASEAAVEQAVADKTIVRTWLMRGTIHYAPAADVRWMLRLLTPRILARNAKRLLQNYSLDQAVFARSKSLLSKTLQGGRRLTRAAMYQALEKGRISTDRTRGLQILWWLAQEGFLCLGPRQGRQPTFVLLDEWLPATKRRDREEALAELAGRYFTSHGPATIRDFAWWSGLTRAEAREAVEAVRSQFLQEEIGGQTYWRKPSASSVKADPSAVYLLPVFDEYTVAYQDRSAVLDSGYSAQTRNGALESNVILNGRIAGTWKRTLEKEAVLVEANLFTPLTGSQKQAFAKAAEGYGAFLGRTVVLA